MVFLEPIGTQFLSNKKDSLKKDLSAVRRKSHL